MAFCGAVMDSLCLMSVQYKFSAVEGMGYCMLNNGEELPLRRTGRRPKMDRRF